ncbi:MAG: hypothetical protein ISR96_08735 [Nitrospira sp.]|nr:hypothetical protein [bacterium]MBL7049585.1 hypothetical protein [Nitrospira sp.]
MSTGIEVTKESIIGEVIKSVSGADKVIEKYFGNGCFTCAGINVESIAFGCTMHNTDPDKIVEELNNLQGGGDGA